MIRRSVPPRHLVEPGPSQADLARMIEAASTAPDHRGLRPYRFLEIADRTALAEAFVVAEREMNPTATEADLDRARERAGHAPCLLAVITRIDDDNSEVTVPEQIASAGAALGYLLLAAHSLGFGAMAVSRREGAVPLAAFEAGTVEKRVASLLRRRRHSRENARTTQGG